MCNIKINTLLPALNRPGLNLLSPLISRWICLDWLNKTVIAPLIAEHQQNPRIMLENFTKVTNLKILSNRNELINIPKTGPCIIIANHPTDLLDDIIVADTLSKVRQDYKFTANGDATKLELWNSIIFPLELDSKTDAQSKNFSAIRDCINWLKAGHVLITYPGAKPSVLSQKIRKGRNIWSSLPALLANKTLAPIVPIKITIEEPWHHKFLKQVFRHAYSLLVFRVLKRFSNKEVRVTIGKQQLITKPLKNKQEAGSQLEQLVCTLS